jgi:hypothetical protein
VIEDAPIAYLPHPGPPAYGVLSPSSRPTAAITFGYTGAVEALARCGARVDNIMFAAALGNLPSVTRYFDGSGGLRPGGARSAERIGAAGPRLRAEGVVPVE